MCGRFILQTDLRGIEEAFDVRSIDGEYRTGEAISPGQPVSAVLRRDGENRLVPLRWGLVPSWAKDPSIGRRMFNARAETVAEKPSFKTAFRHRRCLIPADGFYEWQKNGRLRRPFLFRLKSGRPLAFAGLYESWKASGGPPLLTCTIITTQPNELIKPVHDRMPVILPADRHTTWMDADSFNSDTLLALLIPYPAEGMDMQEVRFDKP